MKKYFSTLIFLFSILLYSCRITNDPIARINREINVGNLTSASEISDSLEKVSERGSHLWMVADSLKEIAGRIKLEYTLSEDKLKSQLSNIIRSFSDDRFTEWERKDFLDSRIIDGQKKYFKRSASNLKLLNIFHDNLNDNQPIDSDLVFRLSHTALVLKTGANGQTACPVNMKIKYTITVKPGSVPAGEVVRCWLPYPRNDQGRQKDISLLETSQEKYIFSPSGSHHSTIYMEKAAEEGKPVVFSVSYKYTSYAQRFDLNSIRAEPYNKQSDIYRTYTSEQLPHINFSPKIRRLADSISGNDTDPVTIVRNSWYWFKNNIPWTGAPEYSIIPDIAGFTLLRKTGDCGMQTFLFMSILRSKGIPMRWQSGWMVPPDAENLHDWCEVYFEGTGWVPVDVSYVQQNSENPDLRDFYVSGLDAYRLIINDNIAGKLFPPKKFLRSEPYDFQRGEVEWEGGNLYFDKWNYNMKIEYLE